MNILGIGPLELIFIVIIMILVLGPQQMVVTARKAGALIRKIVKSPMWSTIMDTSREIREIPTKLVREAGLDEEIKEIRNTAQSVKDLKNISVSTDPLNVRNSLKTTSNVVQNPDTIQPNPKPIENSILEISEASDTKETESVITTGDGIAKENLDTQTKSNADSDSEVTL